MAFKCCLLFIILFNFSVFVLSRKECIEKKIEGSDTVCVCNTTYCDNFPALHKTKSGNVLMFESNKNGNRFQKKYLYFNTDHRLKSSGITITLNKNKIFQTIDGFGGGFTDSTGAMLRSVDQRLAAAIIDSYFSANGIEYSMGRVPVAATDYSLRPYTYDDVYGDKNLTNFSLQKEDFEWKIPYIKMAQKVSPHKLKLIGTNWSPPVWMKNVEELVAFSELKGEVGGEYYQILANYLLKFLESYRENGVEFWGLTSENEPAEDHGNPCLKMTPESLKVFVRDNLGPTLKEAGFDKDKLKILLMDEGIPFIKNWTDHILADNDVRKYVSGIALHWYYNDMLGHSHVESLYKYLNNKYQDLFVINTEACILDGPTHGNWTNAERYAHDIIRQLNHWAVGWIEWNMVLDMKAGPTWFERLGCGGPVYIDPERGEAYKQPSFYALGHFSKFVSPNSVRIEHNLEGNTEDVFVLTAKRPDNGLVLIVLNKRETSVALKIKYQNKYLNHKIGGHAIQSYIWW